MDVALADIDERLIYEIMKFLDRFDVLVTMTVSAPPMVPSLVKQWSSQWD